MIDYSNLIENMIEYLQDYIEDNNLQSVCIGVSGGIDSTISACIAHLACKGYGIPLIGRSLPTDTNSSPEREAAIKVGMAFCDDFKEVPINIMYNAVFSELAINEGSLTHLQCGNVKARLRMIYLRNLASIHKGIVLDNDNFTEWNTGFWTVGGDSPMDINLGLHYLWKTEIYELADYLCDKYMESTVPVKHSKQSEAILKSMKLIPTDGNGVMAGGDCAQMGLENYEQVDDVLKTMYYDTQVSPDFRGFQENPIRESEYIRLIDSYNKQGVDKVMMLHQNTAFKRKELPIKPTKEELGL